MWSRKRRRKSRRLWLAERRQRGLLLLKVSVEGGCLSSSTRPPETAAFTSARTGRRSGFPPAPVSAEPGRSGLASLTSFRFSRLRAASRLPETKYCRACLIGRSWPARRILHPSRRWCRDPVRGVTYRLRALREFQPEITEHADHRAICQRLRFRCDNAPAGAWTQALPVGNGLLGRDAIRRRAEGTHSARKVPGLFRTGLPKWAKCGSYFPGRTDDVVTV